MSDLIFPPNLLNKPDLRPLTQNKLESLGKTLPVEIQKISLSEDEKRFLATVQESYWRTGTVPSLEVICQKSKLSLQRTGELNRSERVREILYATGIELNDFRDEALTPQQLATADILLNYHDKRTTREKLSEVKVSTQRLNIWLRDEVFLEYLRVRSDHLLRGADYAAKRGLVEAIDAGDFSAIKYYFEFTGQFTPKIGGANVDITQFLTKVFEILAKHIKDPETLERIAIDVEVIGNEPR